MFVYNFYLFIYFLNSNKINCLFYFYKQSSIKDIYLYCNKAPTGVRSMYALFLTPNKKAFVWVIDTVRTNRMANLNTLYGKERSNK